MFQPLFHLPSQKLFGHEAFVRIHHQQASALSPWKLFVDASQPEEAIALDRLCRTLHVLNFLNQAEPTGELFLNVHTRLLEAVSSDHGAAFARVLRVLGFNSQQVVIELPPMLQTDRVLAVQVCANYRFNGFRIALNVHTNSGAEALIRTTVPDFVKLDADELLADSAALVETCQSLAIPLIATRTAKAVQADALLRRGAQYAQGYGFGEPQAFTAPAQKLSA